MFFAKTPFIAVTTQHGVHVNRLSTYEVYLSAFNYNDACTYVTRDVV